MEEVELPSNLEMRIYACKLATNQHNSVYFTEIPLKGDTIKDFSDGKCVLDGLKFDTTSYNNSVTSKFLRLGLQISSDDNN